MLYPVCEWRLQFVPLFYKVCCAPFMNGGYNYYEQTYSLDALKQMKENMIAKHNRYLYEKAHPKPKIGETYNVYLCGNHVDTLHHVTNISSNEHGAYFTITNEDGSTSLKEFWGSGSINWTRG